MASTSFKNACKTFLFLIVCSFLAIDFVASTEILVGGDNGWTVPKSKNDLDFYNQWASKNRFKVDDLINFKYEGDSVMEVTDKEYEKCQSLSPSFFSNNGDTYFKLDRPGYFYFISGVTGHCQKGQRMIIKVLEPEGHHQSANSKSEGQVEEKKNGASPTMASSSSTIVLLLAMSFIVLHFV